MEKQDLGSSRQEIAALQAALVVALTQTNEIDTPGWKITRPSIGSISDRIEFMVAEAKVSEQHQPLILPNNTEACVLIMEGAVRIGERTLQAPSFWTVHDGEERVAVSLIFPTKVVGMFYKTRSTDAG